MAKKRRCNTPGFPGVIWTPTGGVDPDAPYLVIKPGSFVVEEQASIQLKTFLVDNGVETELTSGLEYVSLDTNVAVVGVSSGNVTGWHEGIATIRVTYTNLTATAQATVVPALVGCSSLNLGFLMIIDNSRSSNIQFNTAYLSKMAFAKYLAKEFISSVNTMKDKVAAMWFNAAGGPITPLDSNVTTIKNAIDTIVPTDNLTNLEDGLRDGINYLNAATIDKRIIVLFTDGERSTGLDPLTVANPFKAAGNIVIVVGLRANGNGMALCSQIASGGFFLNAYPANASQVLDYLKGLKSYLCGSDCEPSDVTIAKYALNYTGFVNWDVTAGTVDLIGNGTFDFLPGHGMYVDMCGSNGQDGALRSKVAYTFASGKQYKLSYKLAGNQRENLPGYAIRVTVGTLLNVTVPLDNWAQDFTLFSNTFMGDGATHKITFEQLFLGDPALRNGSVYGNLLDDVLLENLTDAVTMLDDNFNNENLTYYPVVTGYGDGCLIAPPPAQTADASPPPDIENGDSEQDAFVFANIGDFGVDNANELAVMNMVKSWNPKYIIGNGDNCYSPTTYENAIGKYLHQYLQPYTGPNGAAGDEMRFFTCPGNHDWDIANLATYLSYLSGLPGNKRYYSVIRRPVEFFFMSSDPREPDGNGPSSTQANIMKALWLASTARWKIGIIHDAPYNVSDHSTDAPGILSSRWDFTGLDLVLSGDTHHYSRTVVGGLNYIVNGAGGRTLYGVINPFPPGTVTPAATYVGFGAGKVTISRTQLKYEFFATADGLVKDTLLLTKP